MTCKFFSNCEYGHDCEFCLHNPEAKAYNERARKRNAAKITNMAEYKKEWKRKDRIKKLKEEFPFLNWEA